MRQCLRLSCHPSLLLVSICRPPRHEDSESEPSEEEWPDNTENRWNCSCSLVAPSDTVLDAQEGNMFGEIVVHFAHDVIFFSMEY